MKKKNKGITLIALTITVIILIIIAGISISTGKVSIQKAKLEELKTNMLLIKAKSKEYVEEVNFKKGNNADETKINEVRQEVYTEKAQLGQRLTSEEIPEDLKHEIQNPDTFPCYFLTEDAKKSWGLDKMEMEENEKYLIQFFEDDEDVEVYNTVGYQGIYSLENLENYAND